MVIRMALDAVGHDGGKKRRLAFVLSNKLMMDFRMAIEALSPLVRHVYLVIACNQIERERLLPLVEVPGQIVAPLAIAAGHLRIFAGHIRVA